MASPSERTVRARSTVRGDMPTLWEVLLADFSKASSDAFEIASALRLSPPRERRLSSSLTQVNIPAWVRLRRFP